MEVRRYAPVLAIAIAVVLALVNATVFAYRWLRGTIEVEGPTAARGAACVGFYSSAAQSGITLPSAGTNYNAPTYGTKSLSVTPGDAVCQWSVGGTTYSLYESITVTIPVTVGSWYIKDFYGFGYNGTAGGPTVYVYLVVEDAPTEVSFTEAKLILYKGAASVGELDLATTGTRLGPISLSPGEALQLDLRFDAQGTGTATFRVGFYATQRPEEAPR